MATNRIPTVARILEAKRRGWPEGTGQLHKEVDGLIQRIQELENALEPFARIGERERQHGLPLVNVYLSDCLHAGEMLNPARGVDVIPKDTFFSEPA